MSELAVLLGLILVAASASSAETAAAKVRVNLRSAPDLESRIVAILPRGGEVEILNRQGEFREVRRLTDGKIGFVRARMLTAAPSVPGGGRIRLHSVAGPELAPLDPVVLGPDQGAEVEAVTEPEADNISVVEIPVGSELGSLLEAGGDQNSQGGAADQPTREAVPDRAQERVAEQVALKTASELPAIAEVTPAIETPGLASWMARGWSVSLKAGYGLSDVSAEQLAASLAPHAQTVEVRSLDESSPGFAIALRKQLSPRWSIEAGLLDFGDYNSSLLIQGADPAEIKRALADHHPGGGLGLMASVSWSRAWSGWTVGATAGTFKSFEPDIAVVIDGEQETVTGRSFSPVLGTAVGYQLAPHWVAELTVEHVQLNQTVIQTGMQLRYSWR